MMAGIENDGDDCQTFYNDIHTVGKNIAAAIGDPFIDRDIKIAHF